MRRYCVNKHCSFKVASPDTVLTDTSLGLISMAAYRLVLEFSGGATMREVFEGIETEMPFEAFRQTLARFVAARILVEVPSVPAAERRLHAVWRKEIFEDRSKLSLVRRALRSGRAVAIRDAFDVRFARRVHHELATYGGWRCYEHLDEASVFHFRHHKLSDTAPFPPLIDECDVLFGTPSFKQLVERLTDADTGGPVTVSASQYLPGDYTLPHDDQNRGRSVAFVWHLAEGWQPGWGGHFYWCGSRTYLPTSFNTLVLFRVSERSAHFVCPVSPAARGRRLSVHGWWTRSQGGGPQGGKGRTKRVSLAASGEGADQPPLIVP